MTNNEEGEAEKMSAQKRRNILVGFGGVAVVLALAVIFLSPNFPYRSEDASGAIGAVRKHRAPQIAQNDVVLGDESFKQEQKILYGDLLDDAAALQSISADMASDVQNVESRAAAASRNLAARYANLQARYDVAARSAVGIMNDLGLANADVQNIAARASLASAEEMDQIAARLANAAEQLAARKYLADAEQQLASFSLAARESQTLAASPQLDVLRNAAEQQEMAMRLRAHVAYLEAMANEAQTLDRISRSLQSRQSLNARNLGRMSSDLLAAAQQLEARAVQNMEMAVASDSAALEALGRMSESVMAARNALQNRQNLEARAAAGVRSQLASLDQFLSSRKNAVQARATIGQRSQLEAVNRHLEARSAAGSKASLASAFGDAQNLSARASALAARVALDARKR